MSAKAFLDTNILVYAYDSHDLRKQAMAQQILRAGLLEDTVFISAQVLGEFFVTVTRKIPRPLSAEEAQEAVDILATFPVVDVDRSLSLRAIDTHRRHQISYWDALIVAAAQRSGCGEILSEDLQDGQAFDGTVVRNPFG